MFCPYCIFVPVRETRAEMDGIGKHREAAAASELRIHYPEDGEAKDEFLHEVSPTLPDPQRPV